MRRLPRQLTYLLWIIVIIGACRPLVAPLAVHPTLRLLSHVSGSALSVAVQGDYVLVGFSTELVVLDTADPAQLHPVATLPLPANDIVVNGQRAVVVGAGGFTLLDLTEPSAPLVRGRLALDLTPSGVALAGRYAYIIGRAGLLIIDLSNPQIPTLLSHVSYPDQFEGIAVQAGIAYITGYRGLYLIDVTDPRQPKQLSLLASDPADGTPVLSANRLYFGSSGQVQIVDISNPAAPQVIARAEAPTWVSELTVNGTYIYVANGVQGVRVFDARQLDQVIEVAHYRTHGLVLDVAVEAGYLYLIDLDEGLHIVDVAEPANMHEDGGFTPLGNARRIACTLTDAYVMAGWNSALHRLDCTDPMTVQQVAAHISTAFVYDFALADHYLYLITADGLLIIDIAARDQSALVGRYLRVDPSHVAVAGHTMYLSDEKATIWVVDITDPVHPLEVDHYPALGYVDGMTVVDGRVYLPALQGGMQILTVASDGKLTPIGHYPLDRLVESIAVQPPYAYLAVDKAGIQIVDVAVPSMPHLVSVYDTPGMVRDISLVGNYALVADGPGGLRLLDLRNPQALVEVATYPMPGYAYQVISAHGLIYVVDGLGGLYLFSLTP